MAIRYLLPLLAGALLALAGCGGGGDPAPGGVLRVGDQQSGLLLPLRLSGALTPLTPKPQFTTFTDGPNMNAAFLADAIDLGTMGDTPALLASAAQADVVVLAVTRARPNGFIRLVARPGAGIATLADLKGKKVAVTRGTAGHGHLLLGLDSVGLGQKDIRLVDVPGVSVARALQSGDADAALLGAPSAIPYLKDHPDAVVLQMPDPLYIAILATRKALADPVAKARIRDFVAANARAVAWLRRNPAVWEKAYFRDSLYQDAATAAQLIVQVGVENAAYGPVDARTVDHFRRQRRLLADAGVLPPFPVAADHLFDPAVTREFNQLIKDASS